MNILKSFNPRTREGATCIFMEGDVRNRGFNPRTREGATRGAEQAKET